MTLGIILSGGGARGAYEAGVLSYLYGEFSRGLAAPPAFPVVAGTSVGALNGTFLASMAHDPVAGVQRLVERWSSLRLSQVFRFGPCEVAQVHRVVLGGRGELGAFDVRPFAGLIREEIAWKSLRSNLKSGLVKALTVSATHVSSGRSTVFLSQERPAPVVPESRHFALLRTRIGPRHVLASAAIPVLFPPVRIGEQLYCEGGLRLNTPMAPAIHLGADRLLVVAVSAAKEADPLRPGRTPSLSFMLGKVLNAFLLDHVTSDVEHLEEINNLLSDGKAVYGEDFIDRINLQARRRGLPPRGIVEPLLIRPSQDVGGLAQEHLRRHWLRFDRELGRSFLRLLDVGEGGDADLASYLLFDGAYTGALVEIGRQDARARREELLEFFGTGQRPPARVADQ